MYWEDDWIKTTENLVREEFTRTYMNCEGGHLPNSDDKIEDVTLRNKKGDTVSDQF